MATLDQTLQNIHGNNSFDRELTNRTTNIMGLAAQIQALDTSDPEFLADFQMFEGDIQDELRHLTRLFEGEEYARRPPASGGPK